MVTFVVLFVIDRRPFSETSDNARGARLSSAGVALSDRTVRSARAVTTATVGLPVARRRSRLAVARVKAVAKSVRPFESQRPRPRDTLISPTHP